jgi:protein-tyrosine phosphatase
VVSVLFVCMGNICRSPTAEGVFRHLVESQGLGDQIQVDGAGTHDYHIGKPADDRSARAAARRGIDLSRSRGRQVAPRDLDAFDYVLAMDQDNLRHLKRFSPGSATLGLFLEYAPELKRSDVPDPYFGGGDGFEIVLDLVETAAKALLINIQRIHGIP